MKSIFKSFLSRCKQSSLSEDTHSQIPSTTMEYTEDIALNTPSVENPAPFLTPASILIELFQSQGCDSCPPTNHNLISLIIPQPQTISQTPAQEYILLTYHVTYWNCLGWTDTFGQPANDTCQRDYIRRMRPNSEFKPMIVVNGRAFGVGIQRGI